MDKRNQIIPKLLLALGIGSMPMVALQAKDIVWYDGSQAVSYHIQKKVDPVVKVACEMFASDMAAVTGKTAVKLQDEKTAAIRVIELDQAS